MIEIPDAATVPTTVVDNTPKLLAELSKPWSKGELVAGRSFPWDWIDDDLKAALEAKGWEVKSGQIDRNEYGHIVKPKRKLSGAALVEAYYNK